MPVDWKAHAKRVIERLGEDVTVRPANGAAAYTVRGIYAAPYAELLAGTGTVGIAGSQPRFCAMADAFKSVIRGDFLARAGKTYRIAALEPAEHTGLVALQLEQ